MLAAVQAGEFWLMRCSLMGLFVVNLNIIKELNLVLLEPTELLSGYPLEVRKVIKLYNLYKITFKVTICTKFLDYKS